MDTSCKLCVFATYEGNVQHGCDFDRLKKFDEIGTVIESKNEDDKHYFIIKDRVCNACTQESALADIPARKWYDTVKEKMAIRCNMAIYVGKDHTMDDAKRSLESIIWQNLPPHEIKILLHGSHNVGEYIAYMTEHASSFDWEVQEVVLEGANYLQALDLTMERIKSTFYTVSNAGYEYPSNYLSTINRAINIDLKRFVALLPDQNGNGFFIQRGLHKLVGGNRGIPVLEKLDEIAEFENTAHMIKRFEDL